MSRPHYESVSQTDSAQEKAPLQPTHGKSPVPLAATSVSPYVAVHSGRRKWAVRVKREKKNHNPTEQDGFREQNQFVEATSSAPVVIKAHVREKTCPREGEEQRRNHICGKGEGKVIGGGSVPNRKGDTKCCQR